MKVLGPIEVTENSHPFSSMKFARKVINVEDYGFVEEEYFVSAIANVYDFDKDKEKVFKFQENIPYTTRILVRRPLSKEKFTGRCYIDIMNASNNYDIEDLWRRSYLHIMENNHMYIGVTSKPTNILSLKNFDLDRYRSLSMPAKNPAPQPAALDTRTGSIDGCEDGLIWDILYQVGREAKNNPQSFCGGLDVKYLYLSGQSQSGMYLNTYVNFMHNYYKDQGCEKVYDGYLSLASGGLTRALRQDPDEKLNFAIRPSREEEIDVPVITFNTECDYHLFGTMGDGLVKTKNENSPTNKRRYYDMTAAAHTDTASPLVPTNEEIQKTKCPPRILDNEYEFRLNDLKFDYYINAMLDRLHDWATGGNPPQIIDPIDFDKKDAYGHHQGGLRSIYLLVPKASYQACDFPGSTNGKMEFFSKEKMEEIYGSFENYLEKFKEVAKEHVKEGLLTEKDAQRAIDWAKNINE